MILDLTAMLITDKKYQNYHTIASWPGAVLRSDSIMLIISKVLLYWTVIVANNNNNWHLKQISSSHRFYIRSTNLSILIKTFENILSFWNIISFSSCEALYDPSLRLFQFSIWWRNYLMIDQNFLDKSSLFPDINLVTISETLKLGLIKIYRMLWV